MCGELVSCAEFRAILTPFSEVIQKPLLLLLMYQSNQSLNNPPGHLNFWKIFGKFPTPEAEKLFKCPIIGPFQVIKYPHPGTLYSSFYYAPEAVYVNMV